MTLKMILVGIIVTAANSTFGPGRRIADENPEQKICWFRDSPKAMVEVCQRYFPHEKRRK